MKNETENEQRGHLDNPLIDLKRVAENLCISERGVWRLVAQSELPKAVKVGGTSRWFTSDLSEYKARLMQSRN